MARGAKTLRMDLDSPLSIEESQIHRQPGHMESADPAVGRCACV